MHTKEAEGAESAHAQPAPPGEEPICYRPKSRKQGERLPANCHCAAEKAFLEKKGPTEKTKKAREGYAKEVHGGNIKERELIGRAGLGRTRAIKS